MIIVWLLNLLVRILTTAICLLDKLSESLKAGTFIRLCAEELTFALLIVYDILAGAVNACRKIHQKVNWREDSLVKVRSRSQKTKGNGCMKRKDNNPRSTKIENSQPESVEAEKSAPIEDKAKALKRDKQPDSDGEIMANPSCAGLAEEELSDDDYPRPDEYKSAPIDDSSNKSSGSSEPGRNGVAGAGGGGNKKRPQLLRGKTLQPKPKNN